MVMMTAHCGPEAHGRGARSSGIRISAHPDFQKSGIPENTEKNYIPRDGLWDQKIRKICAGTYSESAFEANVWTRPSAATKEGEGLLVAFDDLPDHWFSVCFQNPFESSIFSTRSVVLQVGPISGTGRPMSSKSGAFPVLPDLRKPDSRKSGLPEICKSGFPCKTSPKFIRAHTVQGYYS